MTPQMLICGWCLVVMRQGTEPASHGICTKCATEEFPEMPQFEEEDTPMTKGKLLDITSKHVDEIRRLHAQSDEILTIISQPDRQGMHDLIGKVKEQTEIYADVIEFLQGHLDLQKLNEKFQQRHDRIHHRDLIDPIRPLDGARNLESDLREDR